MPATKKQPRNYILVEDDNVQSSGLTLQEAEMAAGEAISEGSRTVEIYKKVPHTIKVISAVAKHVKKEL